MTADVGIGPVRRIVTIRRRLVTGSAKNGFVFFANGIRLCAGCATVVGVVRRFSNSRGFACATRESFFIE
ncbi:MULTISPECIES: hypothetical protein [Burkholderia]|uniref:Uncharacterized protein n=1 Tax=Burkholderia humptydooensis TaxID=430531 RepID=A0A7T2U8Q3_9BURK|nr:MULTISPECIES: hypothetical protein [Burkholderia]QPS47700.1 hypothetical protein I6G56_25225 [Burkholderia humptydooensis]